MSKRAKEAKPRTTAEPGLPPFPSAEDLVCSDEELGRRLLDHFIAAEADARGLSTEEIPTSVVESVVSALVVAKARDVDSLAIERALHEAAAGAFAEAGRVLRAAVAHDLAFALAAKNAVIGLKRRTQMASFAKIGGDAKKDLSQEIRARVANALREIQSKERLSQSRRAQVIAKKIGLSVHTVRAHLRAIEAVGRPHRR